MKKNIKLIVILCIMLSATSIIYAQTARVGINTDTPKSTLDVIGQRDSTGVLVATDITGLQAPRMTRAELTVKGDLLYGDEQKGAIIFVTDITAGNNSSQRAKITSVGYYYFDGSFWQKFVATDNVVYPTGFERRPDMSATNYHWRLIGAPTANYGTEGKYGLDATWNPADMNEKYFLGVYSYNDIMGLAGFVPGDLGALGQNSFTAGTINSASGTVSTALGTGNKASGFGSFASGVGTKATFDFSTSMGRGTLSSGYGSFAVGLFSEATNEGAVAMGNISKATGSNAVAIGQENTASAQATLAIGNTNTAGAVSAVGIGQKNIASGQGALAIGNTNTVSNTSGVGIGQTNNVAGEAAIAIGNTNTISAVASSSIALGFVNSITGESSFALGNSNTLSALRTFALGGSNVLTGSYSKAIGYGLTSSSMYNTSIGLYNTAESSPQPGSFADLTKRLVVIGNGTSSVKSDAFTILRNGKTGIDIDNFESTTSDAKLQVNGTVKIATLSTTSTCNATNEGTIQYLKTAGIGSFQGCAQTSATPTFGWVNLN